MEIVFGVAAVVLLVFLLIACFDSYCRESLLQQTKKNRAYWQQRAHQAETKLKNIDNILKSADDASQTEPEVRSPNSDSGRLLDGVEVNAGQER